MDCIFYSYTYMYTYTRYDMAYTSPAPVKDSPSTAKTGAHVGATEKGAPAAPPSSITQHNQRRLTHPGSRHSARRSHWPRPPLATHSDCHSRLASQTHPAAHDTPSTSAASSATWAHWDRSPGATARHSSSGGHTLHSASGTSWRTNRIQVRVVVRPRCASVRNRHRHTSISPRRIATDVRIVYHVTVWSMPVSQSRHHKRETIPWQTARQHIWRMPYVI